MAETHLPTLAEIDALLDAQCVPAGVRAHANAVASLAYWLAIRLQERGIELDPLLVHRGGLLHDLDKVTFRQARRIHGELGAEALREAGFPELADAVERHLTGKILDPDRQPSTWEQKIVFYADQVVIGEQAVCVHDRLADSCRRYPEHAQEIQQCLPAVLALEQEICRAGDLAPEQAEVLLRTHGLLKPAAAVLTAVHWSALRELDARLRGRDVLWALTGSAGLALQGVPVPAVHDLDVQTGASGAYVVERAFPGQSVRPVTYVESERIRSHYGELRIAGLKVELMGDVAHRPPSGAWEPPLDLAALITWVDAGGLHLPVMSLVHEQQAYLTLGRPEKARLIAAALAKRGETKT